MEWYDCVKVEMRPVVYGKWLKHERNNIWGKDMLSGLAHNVVVLVNEVGLQRVRILTNRHWQIFAQNVVKL